MKYPDTFIVYIMFNKLTCKVRYEAWVNAIRASSFIENIPQINAKPVAFQRNLLGKLPRNRPFFLPIIFQRNWPRKSREFAAKSAIFPANLILKIPRNLTFFSATYHKPCIKVWLEMTCVITDSQYNCGITDTFVVPKLQFYCFDCQKVDTTYTSHITYSVFLSECTIAGIPCWNQRSLPEKRNKGQFDPFLFTRLQA